MVSIEDARRRAERSAHSSAQPRGRGVAPRRDDAQPRGDHRRGRGSARAGRLLQARARLDLRGRVRPAQSRRTGRPGDGRRGAAPLGSARTTRWSPDVVADPGRDSRVGERVALRADRRRARDVAAPDRDRGRHPGDGVRRRGRGRRDPRPRRGRDLRGRRAACRRHDHAAASRTRGDDGPAGRACTTAKATSSVRPPATTTSTRLLLGMQPSTLTIVAARPGQGKTSLALGMAQHVALHGRKPVLFFSMEMGYLELTKRLLAAEARVPSRKLQTGKLSEHEWPRVNHADRTARRSTVLHRRQPALHGDGDARQGAAHQGPLRRPRADRRRLPAAHVDDRVAARTVRSRFRSCRAA